MSDDEQIEGYPTVAEHVKQSPVCPPDIATYEIIPDEDGTTREGVVGKCPNCGALVLAR